MQKSARKNVIVKGDCVWDEGLGLQEHQRRRDGTKIVDEIQNFAEPFGWDPK